MGCCMDRKIVADMDMVESIRIMNIIKYSCPYRTLVVKCSKFSVMNSNPINKVDNALDASYSFFGVFYHRKLIFD